MCDIKLPKAMFGVNFRTKGPILRSRLTKYVLKKGRCIKWSNDHFCQNRDISAAVCICIDYLTSNDCPECTLSNSEKNSP